MPTSPSDILSDRPKRSGSGNEPTPPPRSKSFLGFVGAWAAADEEGDLYNLVIDPSGSAVSTWSKGKAGPRGERGYWEANGEELIVAWDNGWHDRIAPSRGDWLKLGYGPKTLLAGPPTTRSTVFRVRERLLPWVGVWDSSAATVSLVVLRSDGSALRLAGARLEGHWTAEDGSARISWADGTHEALSRQESEFRLVPIEADGPPGAGVPLRPAVVPQAAPRETRPEKDEDEREDRERNERARRRRD